MKDEPVENRHYRFFSNTKCEYFPCHKTADPNSFNCLFCYCPLYALGRECHGNFVFTDNGIKDCSDCLIPHGPHGYDYVTSRFSALEALARETPPSCQS